jgi:hypothetical protein
VGAWPGEIVRDEDRKKGRPPHIKEFHRELAESGCFRVPPPYRTVINLAHKEEYGETYVYVHVPRMCLVGGPHDGEVLPCPFLLDIGKASELFEGVDCCSWQAVNEEEACACLCLAGIYKGRPLSLYVCPIAPDGVEPVPIPANLDAAP